MILEYKNTSTNIILNKLRDVNIFNSVPFQTQNVIDIEIDYKINASQIRQQADVFANEMISNRSLIDPKRFLGAYQEDWPRLLHEAYVYDRCKCIYYGMVNSRMSMLPEGAYSFPGNLILMRMISKKNFSFNVDPTMPQQLNVRLTMSRNMDDLFGVVKALYPEIFKNMSEDDYNFSFIDSKYEAILRGLYNAKMGVNGKTVQERTSNTYFIYEMSDPVLDKYMGENLNPMINSFLDGGGSRFFYIVNEFESTYDKMRFNESLYFGRAVGFTNKQLFISGNPCYTVVTRNNDKDHFTNRCLHAITGLKTELVPKDEQSIFKYLKINTYTFVQDKFVNESEDNDEEPY